MATTRAGPIAHLSSESHYSRSDISRIDGASNTPTPVRTQRSVNAMDNVGFEGATEIDPVSDQGYDELDMERMENMIEEMRILDRDTEQPSEWEVVSNTSGARVQQNEMPAQMLAELEQYQIESNRLEGTKRSRQEFFRVRTTSEGEEPIVRLTEKVWDDMLHQLTILKKDKLEALAKISNMERENYIRRQIEGGDSDELDQLRYRLAVNKDNKAAMSRDIRQKDIELHKKNLEVEDLKERLSRASMLQSSVDKLYAENNFLRKQADEAAEAAKQNGANAGSFVQLIEFKDQENSRLMDMIGSLEKQAAQTEIKLSSHQSRAENLADTQAVREKKL